MAADSILNTYDQVAERYARERSQALFEATHLQAMLDAAPGPRVLDLGCGPGAPIARWLATQGARVTGVDGAAAMVELFRRNLPDAPVHLADMRTLDLGQRFDAVLAWDSFFHLEAEDQRAMFAIFAAHACPGTRLMFTSGHEEGTPIGQVGGQPVSHFSFEPAVYRKLLKDHGFRVISFTPQDASCGDHSIWHAEYRGT